MNGEYITKAIVLDRKPRGELDCTVVLYTKERGKVSALARSIRRPTSKLAGHLVQGNIVDIRLVERRSPQVIDALSEKPSRDIAKVLELTCFLEEVAPDGERDTHLWYAVEEMIRSGNITPATYRYLLEVLGFGFEGAACGVCDSAQIAYFSPRDIMFICNACADRNKRSAGTYIYVKDS